MGAHGLWEPWSFRPTGQEVPQAGLAEAEEAPSATGEGQAVKGHNVAHLLVVGVQEEHRRSSSWSPRAGGLCLLMGRQQLFTDRCVTGSAGPGGQCWPHEPQSVNSCRGCSISWEERLSCLRKYISRAEEMAQWIKVPELDYPVPHGGRRESALVSTYVPWHVCTHTQYTHMPTHAIALSLTCYESVHTQYQQTRACTCIPLLDYTHHDRVHLVL